MEINRLISDLSFLVVSKGLNLNLIFDEIKENVTRFHSLSDNYDQSERIEQENYIQIGKWADDMNVLLDKELEEDEKIEEEDTEHDLSDYIVWEPSMTLDIKTLHHKIILDGNEISEFLSDKYIREYLIYFCLEDDIHLQFFLKHRKELCYIKGGITGDYIVSLGSRPSDYITLIKLLRFDNIIFHFQDVPHFIVVDIIKFIGKRDFDVSCLQDLSDKVYKYSSNEHIKRCFCPHNNYYCFLYGGDCIETRFHNRLIYAKENGLITCTEDDEDCLYCADQSNIN